ncbi:hypothetical protein BG910_08110 [Neisseria chenwenguii]|uniref:Maltose/galactoside acetyltransferase domain-containing protein n=2 Tax=Neisseria chenwenguii TaxID=1853278 RepID=A0A220S3C6_9NEIS|nr:hypothetical protein BG910_08110 [Neisseria chenwenguii]
MKFSFGEQKVKTEKQKMLEGVLYDANYNPELAAERVAADLCFEWWLRRAAWSRRIFPAAWGCRWCSLSGIA